MKRSSKRSGGDALELATRRYRRLLAILPAEFRRRAEAEIIAMFRGGYRRRQDAPWPERAAFWVRVTADAVASSIAERWGRRPELTARAMAPRHHAGAVDRGVHRRRAAGRVGLYATGVRQAARRLLRDPGRSVMTASTLGLGIGGALVMLTVVRGVLLRPLPFGRPDRLVRVLEVDEGGRAWWPSFANFADWRDHGDVFAGIAAVDSPRVLPVIHDGRAIRLAVGRATLGLFGVLGVPLAHGRDLAAGEPGTALVSAGFWRDELGSRPLDELSITVGLQQFRVVGVTPPGFHFLGSAGEWSAADVWVPLDRDSAAPGRRTHGYHVVGRLAEFVDLATARQRMDDLAQTLAAQHGEPTHAQSLYLTPLQEVVVGDARQPLTVLTYAALLVLVVAVCNLAGALLAAGLARRAELGVRRALGATRAGLVRHLLVESLLLAVPGTLSGLAIAWCGVRLLRTAAPVALARLGSVSLDGPAVMTAFGVALAATLLGGLVPALVLSGAEPARVADNGGRTTGGRRESRFWRSFVAAQVAVTVVLLAAGGLLAKSFYRATHVDLGYDAGPVLAIAVSLPESRYADPQARVAFFERAIRELGALPGVTAVGVTNILPQVTQALIGGAARPDAPETWMFAGLRTVNDGYFDALAIPRLASVAQPGGVVVDQSIAEVLYDGASPVGRTLSSSLAGQEVPVTGLVGAVREWNQPLHAIGTLYADYREYPDLLLDAYLLVRADVAPGSLSSTVRGTLERVDPLVPLQIDALRSLVGEALAERRLVLGIAAAFCLVTLTLASVGVYSVVAFTMRRSRREMAIRIALGARPAQVRRVLLRRGVRPAILGSLLGVVVAVPAGGLLRSQLFGVEPYDPAGVVGAVATLLAIAALAAYLPTRSASRQDPVVTLRQQ